MKIAIIFASVHHGNTRKVVEQIAQNNDVDLIVNLPEYKEVFLICTHGGSAAYQSIETIIKDKHCNVIGKFSCKGYDTFGPFKLVGGIAKGHPNEKDLTAAMEFYQSL